MRYLISLLFYFILAKSIQAQSMQSLVDTTCHAKPMLKSFAESTPHMNLLFATSMTADAEENTFEKLYFKMNYLRWELKGTFMSDFSYHFRQSCTKKALPAELDKLVVSVDYAYIGWQLTPHFSLTAGKQLLNFGGYEFFVSGIKVKEFSDFNDYMSNYGTGLTGSLQLSANQNLSLQIADIRTDSDENTYRFGLPEGIKEGKTPLLASLNWDAYLAHRALELRYSLSFGQQASQRNVFYFTSGHIWRNKKVLAYLDVNFSLEGIDSKGLLSAIPTNISADRPRATAQHATYFCTIANVDYRINDHWNVFAKTIYESGGITRTNAYYAKGTYLHTWQAQLCAEYYPKKNLDLKLYLHARYKQHLYTDIAQTLGGKNDSTQRIALGVVYAIPVF